MPPSAESIGSRVPDTGIETQLTTVRTSTDPGVRVPVSGIENQGQVLESHGSCNPATARRALVVEETPSISVLFASRGFTPGVYSPHAVTIHGDSIIGRIKQCVYILIWMNLPLRQESTPTARAMNRCNKTDATMFRLQWWLVFWFSFVAPGAADGRITT